MGNVCGCGQPIWYRPLERTVCAACELRGGPPPPKPPDPERGGSAQFPDHIRCRRPGCTVPVMDVDGSGRRECLPHHRETLAAQ